MAFLPSGSVIKTRRKSGRGWSFWLLIACIGLCLYVALEYKSQTRKVIYLDDPVELELESGMGAQNWFALLESQGVSYPLWVRWVWLRFESSVNKYQAGLYRFENEFALSAMDYDLKNGVIYEPVLLDVTIPEGFTFFKISSRLIQKDVGTRAEWNKLFRDQSLLDLAGVKGKTLEGFIFPATYKFVKIPTALEFLKKAIRTFNQNLPAGYLDELKQRKISLEDAITIASMIEAETRIDDEKPMVSEVIWNRLNRKEALAIDAAIIYGIKDYDGDIKWKHLRDKKNLYNTRVHRGLPPSPIGSPGLRAIKAVVTPTDFGYLFYVADTTRLGFHHFSKTSAEHNRYVRKLVKYEKSRR